jgi:ABC-2 type transport system permease protein
MGIYGLLSTWTEWTMSFQVQGGDVVRYLTKPMDYQLNTLFDAFGGAVSNLVAIAIPTIILSFALVRAPIPHWTNLLLCFFALGLGFLLNFCIDFLVGLVSFITTSIWGFSATKEIIVLFCSGALIPIAFFPPLAREILQVLPFQAIYATPVRILIDPQLSSNELLGLFGIQVLWLLGLGILSRLLFVGTIKRMVINGG